MAEQILGKNGIRAVAGPAASILSVVTGTSLITPTNNTSTPFTSPVRT